MVQIVVGEVAGLSGHAVQCISHDNRQYVLIYHQQQFHLLDNLCPHKGALLCEGELKGEEILCPWHKARFDIHSGKGQSALAGEGINYYATRQLDGQLVADLPE